MMTVQLDGHAPFPVVITMSDSENVQKPIAPLNPVPIEAALAGGPPAAAPAAGNPQAPPPPGKAPPPDRKARGPRREDPRRRTREPMPSLDEPRFQERPKMSDLDAEIEGELEAALAGISTKDLLGAETSASVRQKTG